MTVTGEGGRQVCFVDMPFGKKIDLRSGTEIDFDSVYESAIEPAIVAAGLVARSYCRRMTSGGVQG